MVVDAVTRGGVQIGKRTNTCQRIWAQEREQKPSKMHARNQECVVSGKSLKKKQKNNVCFFVCLFKVRRGREREKERIPSSVHAVRTEPDMGLRYRNCEVMTWAKTKSQRLNWLSHQGTPGVTFLKSSYQGKKTTTKHCFHHCWVSATERQSSFCT